MFPLYRLNFPYIKGVKKTGTDSENGNAAVKPSGKHAGDDNTSVKPDETFVDNDKDKVDDRLEDAIKAAGYSYDSKQDIFYSNLDAWQRGMGYCRLYDEAAAPMGMIIDCEPIYFNYNGKRWLIEFWKGQYDLTTGCEIGVYATDQPDIVIPGLFSGPFFRSPGDDERLQISLTLKRKDKTLFAREDYHWWLTGFKLGEFSYPSELVMDLNITFKDAEMLVEFVKGLKNAGYSNNEFTVSGTSTSLKFIKPHTPQPMSRTPEMDWFMQWKNKLMCDKFQQITGPYNNFPDKISALMKEAPELYDKIIKIVKTKHYFGKYEKLVGYYI